MSDGFKIAMVLTIGGFVGIFALIFAGSSTSKSSAPPPITAIPQKSIGLRAVETSTTNRPPLFKVFRQKEDIPVSMVVAENTSDSQLKSLLWYFRNKIRSDKFSDLGINVPTSKQWGSGSYQSGMLVVFRGRRCANEVFETKGPGICGTGEHDSAFYQWGIDNNPRKDVGAIFSKDRTPVLVFDSNDNWQSQMEKQADPTGRRQQELDRQIEFAYTQSVILSKQGSDMTMHIGHLSNELTMQSVSFSSEHNRDAYLLDFFIEQRETLCGLGFKTVRLEAEKTAGKSYPIPCQHTER
ncbi:MAG: hypothetical protein ABI197_02130 [Granulicella sp.]